MSKRILILIQIIFSLISGIMISKMSFIGKIGISLVYREYSIFKTWWKTALAIFLIMLVLNLIFISCKKLFSTKSVRFVAFILIIIGILGSIYTYYDFTSTSHKYMKSSFHFGGYLFWINWFFTCFYFLFSKNKNKPETIEKEKSLPIS